MSSKKIKLLLTPSLIILFFFLVLNNQLLAAPPPDPKPSVSFFFGKPSYSITENFQAVIQINNDSAQKPPALTVIEITDKKGKKIYQKRFWESKLKTGLTQYEITETAKNLNIGDGVYPVKVAFFVRGKKTTEIKSNLIIISKTGYPLRLAITSGFAEGIQHDADGVYQNELIQKDLDTNPSAPGFIYGFADYLLKNPALKLNLYLSPVLIEQIKDIQDGYKVQEGAEILDILSSSREALNAQKTWQLYQKLSNQEGLEFLAMPYALPDLAALGEAGWSEDIERQVEAGKETIQKELKLPYPPAGLRPSNLAISLKIIPTLAQTSNYVLVGKDLLTPDATLTPFYIPPLSFGKLTVIPVYTNFKNFLKEKKEPHLIVQDILAQLAEVYLLSNPVEKLVTIEIPPQRLAIFDSLLYLTRKTPWIKLEKLSDVTYLSESKTDFTIAGSLNSNLAELLKKFEKQREETAVYQETTFQENKKRKEIEKLFLNLVGLLSQENPKEEQIKSFAEKIDSYFEKLWGRVSISEQKVTLSSQSGKIPINISNNSGVPLKATLKIHSKHPDLVVKKTSRSVILNPQESTFLIPVTTKRPGAYRLKVELLSPKSHYKLVQTVITVESNYFTVISTFLFFTLIAIIVLALVRRFRKEKQNE